MERTPFYFSSEDDDDFFHSDLTKARFKKLFKKNDRDIPSWSKMSKAESNADSKDDAPLRIFEGKQLKKEESHTESWSKMPKAESWSKMPKAESWSKMPKAESWSKMPKAESNADSKDDAPLRIFEGKKLKKEESHTESWSKMSKTESWSKMSKAESNADSKDDAPLRILEGKQLKKEESHAVHLRKKLKSCLFFCTICMDAKPDEEMFRNQHCSHIFCNTCIGRHVAAKIDEKTSVVTCPYPSCKGVLEPLQCSSIIAEEVFDKWEKVICENLVPEAEKFYCPFKDCSAMIINDGTEVVTSSECPHCNRLFCAECKVPWHAEMDCEEFQRLEESKGEMGDKMVMELAKNKQWRRCPECSFYVEKIGGCSCIKCRCGHKFCYECGSIWNTNKHYACGSN